MNRRSGGCITASGVVAALLTLLVFGGVYVARGGQMFSPGALNAVPGAQPIGGILSHAETGGDCAACHVAPWSRRSMDERCLDCHSEIQAQLDDSATLHGILAMGKAQFSCRECHTDHNGSQARLTVAQISDFPHEKVGFSLSGHPTLSSGEAFRCADCHAQGISSFDLAVCVQCHQQMDSSYMEAHQAAFVGECLACHDGIDRYGDTFDHNATLFPLTGKHAQAGCAGCHAGARSIAELQSAPQQCYDCHEKDDPHEGQMGENCETCHVTDGWEQASFDHDQTGFVLEGEHADLACDECHADLSFGETPKECFGCHAEDDAHGGQFGSDCASCHTPEGWEQASFDHALTDFPLTGRHVGIACTDCHVGGVFAGTAKECAACHAEPQFHLELFAASCEECHSTDGWTPASFTGAHIFPMTHGTGGTSTCRTCHPDSLTMYTCYGCHEHTVQGIAEEHLDEGISNFSNCIACHPTGGKDEAEGGDDD